MRKMLALLLVAVVAAVLGLGGGVASAQDDEVPETGTCIWFSGDYRLVDFDQTNPDYVNGVGFFGFCTPDPAPDPEPTPAATKDRREPNAGECPGEWSGFWTGWYVCG